MNMIEDDIMQIETEDSSVKLLWVVLLATAVATLANVIFYLIITRLFNIGLRFPSETPDGSLGWMGVDEVILFSVIFATGAGVVFGLVVYLAKRPIRTYLIIASVTLLLSLALPLRIPSPPVLMVDKLSLVAMHIIGASAVVGVLVRFGGYRK